MKSHVKTFLFAGGAVIIAAVAFWAGSAGRKNDVGKEQAPSSLARRNGKVPSRPATQPNLRSLKRLVESAKTMDGDKEKQVSLAARPQTAASVKDKNVYASVLDVLADLDEGRITEQAAVRRIRELKGGDDRQFLKCLRAMFASAEVAERIRTLAVIEAAYGSDGSPMVIDLDADPSPEEVDLEAHRTHELVGMVDDGLRDPDKTVRDTAFDVFRSLNGDPAFVISRHILMGDDHEQKLKLMDAMANTVTTYAIGLSLDALGNEDEAVRAAAARNLTAVTGKTFASQGEARDWWEANGDDFMQRANSSPDMNAATIFDASDSEESNPPQNNEKEKEQ